jgi:hypothetical protein
MSSGFYSQNVRNAKVVMDPHRNLPQNTNVCLHRVCPVLFTAGPITKLCAWGGEESGGHEL